VHPAEGDQSRMVPNRRGPAGPHVSGSMNISVRPGVPVSNDWEMADRGAPQNRFLAETDESVMPSRAVQSRGAARDTDPVTTSSSRPATIMPPLSS
jgi:hypothetical protein